jgi:predicted GIY-YIG superfamily endonuclease
MGSAVRLATMTDSLHSHKSDFGFYIGFSTDLKRRLSEHMRGASFATKSRGPWKLIYYEAELNAKTPNDGRNS